MKYDIKKQIRSFGYAWKGICHGISVARASQRASPYLVK